MITEWYIHVNHSRFSIARVNKINKCCTLTTDSIHIYGVQFQTDFCTPEDHSIKTQTSFRRALQVLVLQISLGFTHIARPLSSD